MFGALAEIMKPEIDKAYDNGFDSGYDSGQLKKVFDFFKKGIISLEDAVAETELSLEEFETKYQEYLG